MKKIAIGIIVASIMILQGCGPLAVDGKDIKEGVVELIEAEEAATIATTNISETPDSVDDLKTNFAKKNNREYYEVTFDVKGKQYSYEIDALTGSILSSEAKDNKKVESAVEESTDTVQKNDAKNIEEKVESNQEQQEIVSDNGSVTTPALEPFIEQPATNTEVSNPEDTAPNNLISESEIKALVLSRIPGATEADFVEFKLDNDDGKMEYEGEVVYQESEYEFEVDAYSGSFWDWSVESVWDD